MSTETFNFISGLVLGVAGAVMGLLAIMRRVERTVGDPPKIRHGNRSQVNSYMVTFAVDVEADTTDEAVREARMAISDRDVEPIHVQRLGSAGE